MCALTSGCTRRRVWGTGVLTLVCNRFWLRFSNSAVSCGAGEPRAVRAQGLKPSSDTSIEEVRMAGIRFVRRILTAILLCASTVVAAQPSDDVSVLPPRESLIRVELKRILLADTAGLIDRHFLAGWDSVETFKFNGEYWFRWGRTGRDRDNLFGIELFAYSDSLNRVRQITHNNLYWINAYSGPLDGIYLLGGKLFIFADSWRDDPVGHVSFLVVDSRRHVVEKEVHLRNTAYYKHLYSTGDSLHVILQPRKREKNPRYESEFWMPRGRSAKWINNDDGPSWHVVLNREFEVIKEEQVKGSDAQ
jgi:hypothetical protein